jgi:hypothetical protein
VVVVVAVAVVVIVVVLTSGGSSKHPATTAGQATASPSTTTVSPSPPSSSSSGVATPYPADLQDSYLTSCEKESASAAYCQCTLGYFENHVPYSQFVSETETVGTPPDLDAAIAACES